MIYELDSGGFVISSGGRWLPGCYKTRQAAQWAFQFTDKELQAVTDWCNLYFDGIISTDNLRDQYKDRS